jgi:uroporphyrinogen-III synthase
VTSIPVIEIAPPRSYLELDSALNRIDRFDWLILTSVNGVNALFRRMRSLKLPSSLLDKLKIAAIGPATRAAIERRGLRVAFTPCEYVAEAVVRGLRKKVSNQRVLLIRAADAREVIPRELRRGGAKVMVVAAYETKLPRDARRRVQDLLARTAPDIVTFTSSSTVRNFVKLLGRNARERLTQQSGPALASIGPITSRTLAEHKLKATIQAQDYTMEGLARAIARWARSQKI